MKYNMLLRARSELWEAFPNIRSERVQREIKVLKDVNHKPTGNAFVTGLGIDVPWSETYEDVSAALSAAKARDLRRFCLKPEKGHSSIGVRLLAKENGRWRCAMSGRSYTCLSALPSDLREECRQAGNSDGRYILEEFLVDQLGFDFAVDYKVYAFASGCPLLQQRYAPTYVPQEAQSFEFYDRQGRSLGPIRWRSQRNPEFPLVRPDDIDLIFTCAERIVAALGVTFVRLDFYLTDRGVVFGEFTPDSMKGKEYFAEPYEEQLGNLWQRSLADLGLDYRPRRRALRRKIRTIGGRLRSGVSGLTARRRT